MLNRNALIKHLVAVAALASACSAMAYPRFDPNVNYGPGAVVESAWYGRVFQLCLNNCYSKGYGVNRAGLPGDTTEPYQPGWRWSYGNMWQDQGPIGSATVVSVAQPSAPATSWQSGKGYAVGAVVAFQGANYKAIQAIAAGSLNSQFSPAQSPSRWARI